VVFVTIDHSPITSEEGEDLEIELFASKPLPTLSVAL
jgi:hypothetical protein